MQAESYRYPDRYPEYRNRLEHRTRHNSTRYRPRRIKWLPLTVGMVLLAAGIYLVWAGIIEMPLFDPRKSTNQVFATTHGAQSALPETIFAAAVSLEQIEDIGTLQLINADHAISCGPEIGSLSSIRNLVSNGIRADMLRSDALSAVYAMFTAAREANIDMIQVASGFRDYTQQQRLYDEAADKSLVQPPGHSEHQSGLAVDIMTTRDDFVQSGDSKEERWLADNAWNYGLLLRYPADKQDITGIAYEPWHFRYVGQPHARYCFENNLSFEEYIQFLKEKGGYSIIVDGVTYYVSYQTKVDETLRVPKSLAYNVSSDNTGGHIVTAWE